MSTLTGNSRYILRELLPRTVVTLLCVYFVMPYAPGLAFHGGFVAALCASLFFTAYFSLWGAYIMATRRVQSFIESLKGTAAKIAFHTFVMLVIPVLAMFLAVLSAGQFFVYTAWYGLLFWTVALHVCCALTHDYGQS